VRRLTSHLDRSRHRFFAAFRVSRGSGDAGIGVALLSAMHLRSPLHRVAALLALPLLAGCGGGSTAGEGLETLDAGGPTFEDAGNESANDAGRGSASPDAGGGTGPDASDDDGGRGAIDAAPEGGGSATPAIKAAIYIDNWSGSFASWSTKIDFTKMTHLILAFATVSGANTWGNSLGDTDDVQTIVAAAHAKNVKVLVSIGGGGGDQSVISAYQSASNIAPLVANLDTMVASMNLDGVDVDLESPSSMTPSSNYSAFVSALIATFHPEGKLVTSATAEYIVEGQNADATTYATLSSFDFINDMIYSNTLSDFTNEASWWTGSPVHLPPDHLVLGICFGECGGTPSVNMVKQVTTDSLQYGGVMGWDYTDAYESTIWPAMQGAL